MKKIDSVISLSFLVLFLLVGCDNKKVDYQLQEQCGKRSEEYSKKFTNSRFHQNHYNKKLNKCFILVNESEKSGKGLFDVNESKIYGIYSTKDYLSCYVLEKECKSEEEWDSLVKPYMEE